MAMEAYQTQDVEIALRRIGKGICPKSFPITPQSFYFLDLYHKTHGGQYGGDLTHLPLSGGILGQPNIFFMASDIIGYVRAEHITEKINVDKDNISRPTSSEVGNRKEAESQVGGGR